MSDYDFVASGSLKLKKDHHGASNQNKKKKKKNKNVKRKDELLEKAIESYMNEIDSNINPSTNQQSDQNSWMTEAQKKFLAQQEKRQLARVMAKASKTHKQRVEEFNSNLEKLTEHYDIPKVSWTK